MHLNIFVELLIKQAAILAIIRQKIFKLYCINQLNTHLIDCTID